MPQQSNGNCSSSLSQTTYSPEARWRCCVRSVELTYQQTILIISLTSTVFSILVCCHEVVIEGGFDVRNYVIVAFCFVWIIVTALLLMGAHLKTPFLLIPYLILVVAFTPIFMIAIAIGSKVIDNCFRLSSAEMCLHEYHLFGTLDHTTAAVKLSLLLLMLIFNVSSVVIVCRFYRRLTRKDSNAQNSTPETSDQLVKFKRFSEDRDLEICLPLCENMEESKDSLNSSFT